MALGDTNELREQQRYDTTRLYLFRLRQRARLF
jgi:hypothetical protein